ncbi:hypothetical protein [Sphingobium sp.]|uniref:hypothetical protein n=1 Tax=Sphingobium sp. TaxID=1912891 RepID=UPI00257CBB02|nr:hypothetical protein [Sphingobium sp.]
MIEIDQIMSDMAMRRPVFCSEADLQHELAMELSLREPHRQIRSEYPLGGDLRGAIDVLLLGDRPFALELKYLCKGFAAEVNGDKFTLRQQSAHDIRRHEVCEDVARMEAFVRRTNHGAAVLVLSNDPAYWRTRRRADTVDVAFDLADATELAGTLQWGTRAGAGRTRGRDAPLQFSGRYPLAWRRYSDLGVAAGRFRYLWMPVSSSGAEAHRRRANRDSGGSAFREGRESGDAGRFQGCRSPAVASTCLNRLSVQALVELSLQGQEWSGVSLGYSHGTHHQQPKPGIGGDRF